MFLGIEIGGTKLQLGLGTGDGLIVKLWRSTVDQALGGAGIRHQILEAFPELLESVKLTKKDIKGIGIGFGGPTDDDTQSVMKSHQVHGWDGFPLATWLMDSLGLPAYLSNDADVAGLAEAHFGAGKGFNPVFYITVGTGIGGGLILNGEIFRGVGRGAAEIGHLHVKMPSENGEVTETVESLASGTGIEASAKRRRHEVHSMTLPTAPTVRDLAVAARQGDAWARSILQDATDTLAFGIVQMVKLLCPQRVIIGGGVSLLGEELFFEPIRKYVTRQGFPPFAGLTEIVPAALGEEVVVHGALALAQQKFG